MKPISVRFKCFGPYMDEQVIDFTSLGKLFLICGETGAGKTTILDAVSVALYWHSSGDTRGTLTSMRCQLAGKDDITSVEFIFKTGSGTYKFTRSLTFRRTRYTDEHNCMVLRNGVFVPLLENPTQRSVTAEAERIIGLTYEQFSRVIILPQGKFERLLISSSEEKEKILCSLFNADRWERACTALYRRVSDEDKSLKIERDRIMSRLGDYGCTDLAQLSELTGSLKAEHEKTKVLLSAAAENEKRHSAAYEKALLTAQSFERLDRAKRTVSEYMSRDGEAEKTRALLGRAVEAEKLTPAYEQVKNACNAYLKAKDDSEKADALLKSAEDEQSDAEKKRSEHLKNAEKYEKNKERLTLLSMAREAYAAVAKRERDVKDAENALAKTESALRAAEITRREKHEGWLDAVKKQKEANEKHGKALEIYLGGISASLAMTLESGVPCPVCGSTSHPCPAEALEGHITEAQLEQLNKNVKIYSEYASRAEKERADCELLYAQSEKENSQARERAAVAFTALEMAKKDLIEGISSSAELENAAKDIRRAIELYEAEEKRTLSLLQEKQQAVAAKRELCDHSVSLLKQAEKAFSDAKEMWAAALEDSIFEDKQHYLGSCIRAEEQIAMRDELTRHATGRTAAIDELRQLEESLHGVERPDTDSLKVKVQAERDTLRTLEKEEALQGGRIAELEKTIATLGKQLEKYAAERERVDADLEFAKRLQGSTGVGLQRYVLGVMLSAITDRANLLLEGIYGGRYRLYRSDEASGQARKLGLELSVLDRQTGEKRSVTTLSGGEKFLVALSLAIGLSTVVQAQGSGIKIEAMFIDEGFGSLDRDSTDDALGVLSSLSCAGTVGIISHVERLEETIPTRIEVKKGKKGSRIDIFGNDL